MIDITVLSQFINGKIEINYKLQSKVTESDILPILWIIYLMI